MLLFRVPRRPLSCCAGKASIACAAFLPSPKKVRGESSSSRWRRGGGGLGSAGRSIDGHPSAVGRTQGGCGRRD